MDQACNGNCGSCSGCAGQLLMTQPELAILQKLGQIPFLPVARRTDDMTPVYLEDGADPEQTSLALEAMERKGLILIDYSSPLSGACMDAYGGYPVHGSFALTQRGQAVLELLDIQGLTEE